MLGRIDPRIHKLVRRTAMVATVPTYYFILNAEDGPEPSVLYQIKNAILSAQHSLKVSISGPKKGVQEHEAEKSTPSSLEKHQKSGG